MSPGLYSKLQGKNSVSVYDAKKNDYHSLGMTLLYLGLQDSLRDYYLPDGRISDGIMKSNIQKFRNKYSTHPHLYQSIEILTNPDPKLRHGNFGKYSEINEHTHFDP